MVKVARVSKVAVLVLTLIIIDAATANPTGGEVTSGNATINQSGTTTTINQASPQVIINWQSFNIKANETTHFQQPVNGIALNRINPQQSASQIYGVLSATGKIILVNSAGIHFGPSAVVNVGSIIASTADISDANFAKNRFIFDKPSNATGSIINEGTINTAEYGLVALLGTGVVSKGSISANMGSVLLGQGNRFTLDFNGDHLINFTIDDESQAAAIDQHGQSLKSRIENINELMADGGRVQVSARVATNVLDKVINLKGMTQAHFVRMKNGEVILSGSKFRMMHGHKLYGARKNTIHLATTSKQTHAPVTNAAVAATRAPTLYSAVTITASKVLTPIEMASTDVTAVIIRPLTISLATDAMNFGSSLWTYKPASFAIRSVTPAAQYVANKVTYKTLRLNMTANLNVNSISVDGNSFANGTGARLVTKAQSSATSTEVSPLAFSNIDLYNSNNKAPATVPHTIYSHVTTASNASIPAFEIKTSGITLATIMPLVTEDMKLTTALLTYKPDNFTIHSATPVVQVAQSTPNHKPITFTKPGNMVIDEIALNNVKGDKLIVKTGNEMNVVSTALAFNNINLYSGENKSKATRYSRIITTFNSIFEPVGAKTSRVTLALIKPLNSKLATDDMKFASAMLNYKQADYTVGTINSNSPVIHKTITFSKPGNMTIDAIAINDKGGSDKLTVKAQSDLQVTATTLAFNNINLYTGSHRVKANRYSAVTTALNTILKPIEAKSAKISVAAIKPLANDEVKFASMVMTYKPESNVIRTELVKVQNPENKSTQLASMITSNLTKNVVATNKVAVDKQVNTAQAAKEVETVASNEPITSLNSGLEQITSLIEIQNGFVIEDTKPKIAKNKAKNITVTKADESTHKDKSGV